MPKIKLQNLNKDLKKKLEIKHVLLWIIIVEDDNKIGELNYGRGNYIKFSNFL